MSICIQAYHEASPLSHRSFLNSRERSLINRRLSCGPRNLICERLIRGGGSGTPCMTDGVRTCATREPTASKQMWAQAKAKKGEEENVDRFRHASFVEGTSFISARPRVAREGKSGHRRLSFLCLSCSFTMTGRGGDRYHGRADSRSTGGGDGFVRLAFPRARLTALFEKGPRARRAKPRKERSERRREGPLVNELTSARVRERRVPRVRRSKSDVSV